MADDFIAGLCERVRDHAARGAALRIRGGGTKDFYGAGLRDGSVLDMGEYAGIVAYEPRELVLTVRAGTPLEEVERALAAERQMLAFEPPHFAAGATIGGAVACGLSGPRRPYAGRAARLRARHAHRERQGRGPVVRRPRDQERRRLRRLAAHGGRAGHARRVDRDLLQGAAAARRRGHAGVRDGPGRGDRARQRVGGAAPAVFGHRVAGRRAARAPVGRARRGGQRAREARAAPRRPRSDYWRELREQRLAFFAGAAPLWRLSLPQTTEPVLAHFKQLVEWGGGVRWIRGAADALEIRSSAERAGGHATLFRGGDKSVGVFHPLQPAVMKIHRRLKAAFDPAGILNPGRMYDF